MNSRDDLKTSLSFLTDRFGRASPGLATVINLGFIAAGSLLYWQTTGIVAWTGLFFAILSVLAIAKWVIRA